MKLTENQIEQFTLGLFASLGYQYIKGIDLAPNREHQERENYSDVVLFNRLQQSVNRLNPDIPYNSQQEAIREVLNIASSDLISNNQKFHQYLTEGITVEFQQDGETRGRLVWLMDWQNPENNEFIAVNQFTIIEDNHRRRLDIILFVNGLPLVVIELKNPAAKKADIYAAFNQLQTYKKQIPSLFTYNALLVISDGLTAKAGSLSAKYDRFMEWKTPSPSPSQGEGDRPSLWEGLGEGLGDQKQRQVDQKQRQADWPSPWEGSPEVPLPLGEGFRERALIKGMLNKSTLLDLIRHFTVFEESTVPIQKKIAAYHQYYAVNKALESVIRAVPSPNPSQGEGDQKQGPGDQKQGPGDQKQGPGDQKQGPGDQKQGPGDQKQGPGDQKQGPGDQKQGPGDQKQGPGDQKQGQVDQKQKKKIKKGKGERNEKIAYRGGLPKTTLLEQARELRKNQTTAEKIFWEVVRGKRFLGLKFRRQHQIGNYIVDFYCHSEKLVIELDGEIHNEPQQKERDRQRDEYLKSLGHRVLRFTNQQIFNDLETVLDSIVSFLSPE